jgi:dipeptidyl aminopeptidase/acylaminoacyl peptidase
VQGGLIFDGVPATDPALSLRLQRWQQSRPVRLLDWMSDGSLLVASRVGEDEQVLRVTAPLRTPEQLSFFDGAVLSASAQAFSNDALLLSKEDANGVPSIRILELAARHERALSGPADHAWSPLWSHDARRLAYSSPLRTGRDADLYVSNAQGGDAQLVGSGGGEWRALDWSRDDRYLLALRREANGSEQLQRIELASLSIQALAAVAPMPAPLRPGRRAAPPAPPAIHIRDAQFTPDGRSVIALSDEGNRYLRVQLRSIADGDTQTLSLPMSRDVEHMDLSADARYLAYAYPERGQSRVTLLDRRSGAEKIISGLPRGAISALRFDRAGARLAVNIEQSTAPSDVYVIDLATGAAERWTQSELGPIDVATLSLPVPFRFRTVDGAGGGFEPNAMLYRPRTTTTPRAPLSVLILLPSAEHQSLARFDAQLQMLVGEVGLAVIVPTLRDGSSREARDSSVRDVGALLAWIGVQTDLDRSQVAIAGIGSYSDVALAALARFSDRLQRGLMVDGAPDASDMQQLQRPVLIARGFQQPQMTTALAELLLWRTRAVKNDAWLVSVADGAPGDISAGADHANRRAELARVIAQFLMPLKSVPTTAAVVTR